MISAAALELALTEDVDVDTVEDNDDVPVEEAAAVIEETVVQVDEVDGGGE